MRRMNNTVPNKFRCNVGRRKINHLKRESLEYFEFVDVLVGRVEIIVEGPVHNVGDVRSELLTTSVIKLVPVP